MPHHCFAAPKTLRNVLNTLLTLLWQQLAIAPEADRHLDWFLFAIAPRSALGTVAVEW
jgi:hypothetical protein